MYHVTLEQMRLIEWARSFNWAVRFPDRNTPEDFREWFPASDVNYEIFKLEKQDFQVGASTLEIPKSTSLYQLTLTCYDGFNSRRGSTASTLQLHEWISKWGKDMVDISSGVQTLKEACRPIEILHYNGRSDLIGFASYAVFPYGEASFTGSSEGEPNQLELTFCIAGYMGSTWGDEIGRSLEVRLPQRR